MGVLRWLLTIIMILVSIALVVVVLMQEGKAQGLGAISGAAETYWGKNKGRSMEGMLRKISTGLAVAFIVLALILNLNVF
ncbi:MAG: preprotein translocase subunit SecG [Lachnospiraceae bacterium]|nr:preprotein translocase subunit SecG [Lachnospiraceae bacterium]